jgi:hypothetical protein
MVYRKLFFEGIGFLLIISSFFFVSALEGEDTSSFVVDVYKFPELVSIDVPDFVDLGNVTVGFETDPTSDDKIYIRNTGTYNVSVSPRLANPFDPIFKNLYFTWRLSGNKSGYYPIGQFRIDIPWSGKLGEYEEDYIYSKLDLRNMSNINNDLINYEQDVIFIATAQ